MPLKALPYREVKRRLVAYGFIAFRQKGSHVTFKMPTPAGDRVIVVPKRQKDIPRGTIAGILKLAGISIDEWDEL